MARDLALERAWRQRMRRYEQSGLTIREFCKQKDLSAAQFSWWRAELKRRAVGSAASRKNRQKKAKRIAPRKTTEPPRAAAAGFFPVKVAPSVPAPAPVEIVLDQPPRIRVIRGFDAELLRDVIRVLEQG